MSSKIYQQNNREQYIQAAHDYFNSNKDSILKGLKKQHNMLTAEDKIKKNE